MIVFEEHLILANFIPCLQHIGYDIQLEKKNNDEFLSSMFESEFQQGIEDLVIHVVSPSEWNGAQSIFTCVQKTTESMCARLCR